MEPARVRGKVRELMVWRLLRGAAARRELGREQGVLE